MTKLVVSGYRDYSNIQHIESEIIKIAPSEVIVGDCRGVDTCAVNVCKKLNIKCTVIKADWAKHGRAAGPIHNREMLSLNPDCALIFIHTLSKGTLDMLKQCEKKGVKMVVHKID